MYTPVCQLYKYILSKELSQELSSTVLERRRGVERLVYTSVVKWLCDLQRMERKGEQGTLEYISTLKKRNDLILSKYFNLMGFVYFTLLHFF